MNFKFSCNDVLFIPVCRYIYLCGGREKGNFRLGSSVVLLQVFFDVTLRYSLSLTTVIHEQITQSFLLFACTVVVVTISRSLLKETTSAYTKRYLKNDNIAYCKIARHFK